MTRRLKGDAQADDPLIRVANQALQLAERCKFPVDFIHESMQILQAAFHRDWLIRQTHKMTKESFVPFSRHPLGRLLTVPGESQVSELMELAIYIKRLSQVPRLSEVLTNMKNPPEYEAGFLQLAYGYRFAKFGVEDLTFEPRAIDGRKGDLSFDFAGQQYQVECYMPRRPPMPSLQQLQQATTMILKAIEEWGADRKAEDDSALLIRLRLKRAIGPSERSTLKEQVVRAIRDFIDAPQRTLDEAMFRLELLVVEPEELEQFQPKPDEQGELQGIDNPDFAVRGAFLPKTESGPIQLGQEDLQEPRSLLLVWGNPEEHDADDPMQTDNKLVGKISSKLAQTRSPDGRKGILVVHLPFAKDPAAEVQQRLVRIASRLRGKEQALAAVLLVTRIWQSTSRYQYVGGLVVDPSDDVLAPALRDRFVWIGQEEDILLDHL